ncbi:putative TetR family transcriptional regulator [Gordonia effusa NBRC 100432]|uniref:Putative TetR family transcriptional regulator n=1 Tax=Gordonia effusa NBRC 100432 TaxID=1077974 RepID=H0QUY6_9ACTN|nr:TetR/AcrR family transcriptional regulator [Gordonia effusa]GAB16637.1 putative TetR family transcriptional regulator [Gordonia effusa NBRC 100432]
MTGQPSNLPRYLQLMWGLDDGARRGPKPKLTITDIGEAAVAVADAEGFDAVSMKAIAQRLEVTTMSLYRYVEAKEDIYEIMLDVAYGRPAADLTAHGSWRERLAAWAHAIAAQLRKRPWLTAIPMRRPPAGPNTLSWTEAGITAFDKTALTSQAKLSSLLLVDGFVRNHVRMSSELGALDTESASGADQYGVVLGQVIDEERFPRLCSAVRSQVLHDDTDDFYSEELAFGLEVIFDGIGVRIEQAG